MSRRETVMHAWVVGLFNKKEYFPILFVPTLEAFTTSDFVFGVVVTYLDKVYESQQFIEDSK